MNRLRTAWRNLMVLMAACMAAVLVLAPVADAAVCATEAPPPVLAADGTSVAVSDPAPAPDKGHLGGGDAICQHGHCHQAASVAAPAVTDTPLQAFESVKRLMLRSQRLETHAFSRVERPPRA